MSDLIHVGDLVRVSGAVATAATPIDPTSVFFKYKTPSDAVVTYTHGTDAEVVKDSVGNYHVDVSVTEPGQWHYKFYSTGAGQAAIEGEFVVERTEF